MSHSDCAEDWEERGLGRVERVGQGCIVPVAHDSGFAACFRANKEIHPWRVHEVFRFTRAGSVPRQEAMRPMSLPEGICTPGSFEMCSHKIR